MEDVHKLRVFAAVAQYLSFTRAAQALFLTQSAVSHQIAGLELAMNTPLVDRRGKRVSLTPAGVVLRDQCARIFAVMEEAALAVKRINRPDIGTMRIGASPAACQYLIPEAAPRIPRELPRLRNLHRGRRFAANLPPASRRRHRPGCPYPCRFAATGIFNSARFCR